MAFNSANLVNVTGMPPGFAEYVYKSDTDDRETVMASGYFNNIDDDQNFASDDLIKVTGDQGFYKLRVDTVSSGTVTTELAGQSIWIGRQFDDLSGAASHFMISPVDGVIRRMKVVNETVVTDAVAIGLEIGGTNVTDTADADIVTIAASAAVGTVSVGEADTANAVSEGTAIEITSDGGGSGTVQAYVMIEIIPS